MAIRSTGLTKRFGDRAAVDGLDLDVPDGVVCGFIGPNGAGKTTTLRMLLGLVRPTAGTAEVLGVPIGRPADYLPRVGALIEGPAFYPSLSGRRNLDVLARLGRLPRDKIEGLLGRVGLAGRGGDAYATYSLGMKQRLGIAAALLGDPELLVLDEPANGLDPAGIREVRALLRDLADAGMSVFVSSHLLGEIEAICDHLVVIDAGRLVFQGPMTELLARQRGEVLATPEHAGDLPALLALCERAGQPARQVEGRLHVAADPAFAPELNRLAMAAGITLAALGVSHGTLEEAFLSITEAGGRSLANRPPSDGVGVAPAGERGPAAGDG